jgi:hypothetical protein
MDALERWWHEKLEDGCLIERPVRPDDVLGDWERDDEVQVRKSTLHQDMLDWFQRHEVRTYAQRDTKKMLGKRLRKWLPPGYPREDYRGGPRGDAPLTLPSLSRCREQFSRGRKGLVAVQPEDSKS